jgi:hypothetical protein
MIRAIVVLSLFATASSEVGLVATSNAADKHVRIQHRSNHRKLGALRYMGRKKVKATGNHTRSEEVLSPGIAFEHSKYMLPQENDELRMRVRQSFFDEQARLVDTLVEGAPFIPN